MVGPESTPVTLLGAAEANSEMDRAAGLCAGQVAMQKALTHVSLIHASIKPTSHLVVTGCSITDAESAMTGADLTHTHAIHLSTQPGTHLSHPQQQRHRRWHPVQ
jgi:hypothetical protein